MSVWEKYKAVLWKYYLQWCPFVVWWKNRANAISSWEPKAARSVLDGRGRGHHVHELALARRRHDHHVGQASHISCVERSAVRRAICSHKASPIKCKSHRQLLKVHIMNNLYQNSQNISQFKTQKKLFNW